MSAELAGQAYVEMSVRGKEQFAKAFADMQAQIQMFSNRLGDIKGDAATSALSRGLKGIATGFKNLIGLANRYATIAGVAFGAGAVAYFTMAIRKASDFQETMNKFNVVFENQAAAMSQWGDQFAQQMGRSRGETKKMLADMQGFLRPMGIDPAQASQMSQSLTQLAYDLASFNNVADEETFTALMSAISGEAEPMKRFGVIVNDAAMKAELLKRGLDKDTATEAQKAMARYNIILEGTALAQGDVERSSESFANRVKALQAQWADLAVTIGEQFLPFGEALVAWATSVIEQLDGLANNADGASQNLSVLGISMTDLIAFGDGVVSVFHFISGAIKGTMGILTMFLTGLTKVVEYIVDNPVTRTLFGLENTSVAGAAFAGASEKFLKDTESYFESAGQSFDASTKENIKSTIDSIRSSLQQAKDELDARRKEAAQDVDKVKANLNQIENLGPQIQDEKDKKTAEKKKIQAEIDALKGQAQEIANPKALEESSLAAFEKFQENRQNELKALQERQLKALEQIKKNLDNKDVAILAFGD